jgi:antitoxin (DNA-binding transcriptional repressor) of toxin-antitoxin stability system
MIFKKDGVYETETHQSENIQAVESGKHHGIIRRGVKTAELRPLQRGSALKSGCWLAPDFNDTPEDFQEYM